MNLTQLILVKTESFCQEYKLRRGCANTTNVCSKIVFSNSATKITFFIEEMEFFIVVDIEYLNALDGSIKKEKVTDSENDRIPYFRKKALRSWRKIKQEKFLNDMIDEYVFTIQNILKKTENTGNTGEGS